MSFIVWMIVLLNGSPVNFGAHRPYLYHHVTLVPLGTFMRKAGAKVTYIPKGHLTVVKYRKLTMTFPEYGKTVQVNGKAVPLDIPIAPSDGVSYVSLNFLANEMNASLAMDEGRHTVAVTTR